MRYHHNVGDICHTRYGQLVLIVDTVTTAEEIFYNVRFIGNESGTNANFRTKDLIRLVDGEDTCQP